MSGGIFLIQPNGELMEMRGQPYDSESLLQGLLERYPNLLAGNQMNRTEPRRWLLVSREAGVPSEEAGYARWAVDHVFLDQEAIPTLVEVKRSTDTRIRREVVGQMLDYAANMVAYWPAGEVQAEFERTCEAAGRVPEKTLAEHLAGEQEPEGFWGAVKTNLEAGRIRLVFVADAIPSELQRIIEFLNEQMQSAEVLGVEIPQFVSGDHKALVPRVIGQTARAETAKSPRGVRRGWTEATFLAEVAEMGGAASAEVARRILEWGKAHVTKIDWTGSPVLRLTCGGYVYSPLFLRTDGNVYLHTWALRRRPAFEKAGPLEEFIRRAATVPGAVVPKDLTSAFVTVPLSSLADETALTGLLDALAWFVDYVAHYQATEGAQPSAP